MNRRLMIVLLPAIVMTILLFTVPLFAASAPHKAIFTFGGLNERSGVLFVARDAGIFQKHGLDATVVNVRNAAVGMSALASGETQFHVGSATGSSIGAMAGGVDLAFIAGLINKLDGTFVVAPKIRAPEDLKGKRIGVQSIGGGVWMFTMLAFEKWGLNPERDNIQLKESSTAPIWAIRLARRWNARATGYWPIWPQSACPIKVLASWPSVDSSIVRRKLTRKLCAQRWSPSASSTILRTERWF